MKSSFLQLNDELFANLRWRTDITTHVLATAWDDHSLYRSRDQQSLFGPGLNQPVIWTAKYGFGRIFVNTMGHDAAAMRSPGFALIFARGTEWAATGEVTIPVPPELR
jgi:hypothetical protein